MEESEEEPGLEKGAEEEPKAEPEQPLWPEPEQYTTYNSFVTVREESGELHFRSFVLAANNVAEAHARRC